MRLEQQHGDFELVDAQMQDRVVELARDLQRPERRALRDQAVDTVDPRGRRAGPLNSRSQTDSSPMPATDVAGSATPFYSNGLRNGVVKKWATRLG
jgi:hypothetical protein